MPKPFTSYRNTCLGEAFAENIRSLLQKHTHVRLAILFGSVAQGQARFDSDLDLAVTAGRQPLTPGEKSALIEDLAALTGRPVDLIDLFSVGEPLLGKILAGGCLILGEKHDYAALLGKHLFDQADFLPYRNRILEQRRRAWIGI